MATVRIGLSAKAYRNSANYASPTWVEITNIKDLTLTLEKGEADVTVRGNNGWEAIVPTLKRATIEFGMVAKSADADVNTFKTAFMTDATIEMAILDTNIATNGAIGLRAEMGVLQFSRDEPLEEGLMYNIRVKPALGDNPPAWVTATNSVLA